MSATFIPALVIKHNLDVYMDTSTLTIGTTMSIPTPGAGGVIDGDYWAEPITDNVVSGFNFHPTTPGSTDAPSAQSFHVFRLVSRFGNDSWYVRGETTANNSGSPSDYGYIEASQDAECCSESPRALPTNVPVIAACQTMCEWNANGKYFAMFALPIVLGGYRYYPYGYYNDVLLTAGNSHGYTTPDTLLTFLNASWSTVGTWSYADAGKTQLQVVQTAGSGTDVICVQIISVNPSA